ncbi:VanZ family protein [Bacillus sp. Marseille-Q1617]|uniref:VanZ family protein n=1 Tax=Bacillus sp. Marseille-Q1617 TaxID=2736887 RepID=UPI0026DBDDC4|nr:VanZ family protein [Bacillus sp. Marseille-Q1617]
MPLFCLVKNNHKEVIILLRIGAACYFILIFIFTCTESLNRLYRERIPHFKWNSNPDYSAFFDFTSYSFTSYAYIFQKTGHALAFFLLALIVFVVVNRIGVTLLISFSYALFTETAQLFFHRTGCLVDVGYDMAGAFVFMVVLFLMNAIGEFIHSEQFDVR